MIKTVVISLICIATGSPVLAGELAVNKDQQMKADDDYYSADLTAAVNEARKRTHHYDYSSEFRYNRTTSQSIQFARLLNNEMKQLSIETPALEATSSGQANLTSENFDNNSPLIIEDTDQSLSVIKINPINSPPAVNNNASGVNVMINLR